ncbi:hypothetical protein ABPG72_011395 [Tetrahymena utriculariae]
MFTDSNIIDIVAQELQINMISMDNIECKVTEIFLQLQLNQLGSFNNFTKQFRSDNIRLYNSQVQQTKLEHFSSFIEINQCLYVTLNECIFQNNINSNGYGGVIQISETSKVKIYYSNFISNKCLLKNGGAINFKNTDNLGTLEVNFSAFVINQAMQSTGGAINQKKVNLILKNSQIQSYRAQIGGGIYYQQIVPDLVLSLQKGINQNNTIQNNYANIYGKNLGSNLRKINISDKDIIIQSSNKISFNQNSLEVQGIQSGERIIFKKIKILDEEGNLVYIPPIQNQSNLSDDVLLIIRQIKIEITYDQTNNQIQCVGDLKQSNYQNGGFSLAEEPMQKPLSSLHLQVQLNFDECKIGQIHKQFSNFIICESCQEGKYSLDILDDECKKCPDSAKFCSGSKIQLKNGYWRSNEFSDNILYCSFNPDVFLPQSKQSKFNCARGYVGIICSSCDIYGEIWEDSYTEYITSKK